MKSIVAVIVVLSVFFAESHQQGYTQAVNRNLMLSVRPILENCAARLKINRVELDKAIANDLSNKTRPLQCLPLCFFGATQVMNAKGELNIEHAKQLLSTGAVDPERVYRLIDECSHIKPTSDACETAYVTNECMVNNGLL